VWLDRNLGFTLYDQTIMPKRVLDEGSSTHRAKKVKLADKDKNSKAKEQPIEALLKLTTEEVDFPRGGGSSFTPIEVKAIRAEALREADSELFEVCSLYKCHSKFDSGPSRTSNRSKRKGASPVH
jgi:rRNA biogenesis protein RRP5